MKYFDVDQIIKSSDTMQAKTFLKDLWYAMEEDCFSFSPDYKEFKQQFMHLSAYAPLHWRLEWDGKQFSLSKQISNHGLLTISIQTNGQTIYKIS